MTRTLRLRSDVLSELEPDEMRAVSAAAPPGPPTYNCFISRGEPRCIPPVFTGDPCLLTGTPSTEIC